MDRQSNPVKIIFQILQCLHHLVMLKDDANTAGPREAFFQKAKELDRFVRPAMPTPDLADKIESINLAQAFEIRSILVTHYRTQLDFLSGSLTPWNLSATDCAQAKLKAKEWAKRNFGRKLKPQTLSEFDRRVQQIFAPPKSTQTQHSDRPQRILGRAIPVNIVDVQPVPTGQPSPMLTDRLRQPQGHQEQTKPIPRLQNHPLQSPPEHLSPNLPVSPKLPNFRPLVNKNIRLNTWKPPGKFPKSWKTFWWSEPQTFPEFPGCPVMMLKFCAIQASNFSP